MVDRAEMRSHTCKICQAEFVGHRNSRYCSSRCLNVNRNENRKIPCPTCGESYTPSRAKNAWGHRPCRLLKPIPHGTYHGYRQLGCRCAECREANRLYNLEYRERRRQEGRPLVRQSVGPGRWWITQTARLALYERDAWTCQLCNEPIDVGAHYQSDWAASLDHIVPRSRGGSDDPENLRTAHRWCNSIRGDGHLYDDDYFAAVSA